MLAVRLASAQPAPCPPWPPGKTIVQKNVFGIDTLLADSASKKQVKLTEQQIMFSKQVWSYLDFKEKINKVTYSTKNPRANIHPLYDVLNRWISQGKINCFRQANFGDSKNTPLTPAEFRRTYILRDTVEERVIDESGEEQIVKELRTDTLGADQITGFVIKEDWYFNRFSVVAEKKVIGFAPVVFDRKTQRNRPLYWVYYPECCELLSSHLTLNPLDAKLAYTYREAFEARYFNAYILRESNVYARDKPENSKGFEVENENRKALEKYESSEEDLWSK